MKSCLVLSVLLLTSFGLARADDSGRIAALFAPVLEKGGTVTIPPGDYHLEGAEPLPIPSNTIVFAHGARFLLPETLGDKARIILFAGEDVAHFAWHGGEFIGHVFDPAQRENTWEPSVNTKAIEIMTTKEGGTHDILFRDVKSNGVAGAVIGVHGLAGKKSDDPVEAFAERVVLDGCTLLRSGKLMWDYGYLWQIVTWPEDYEAWEVERAKRYFRSDLLRDVSMKKGDDRVFLDNQTKPIPVTQLDDPKESLTFFGAALPKNVARGKQYFIVDAANDFIKISDTPHGEPIRFASDSGDDAALAYYLSATYLGYAPFGSGPGKGAFDIVGVKNVRVTGCQVSALGDTMHIQRCENVIFSNNHILGSRMGAFFLAEHCKNATITGNLVDGTNGSRVMSVERSCTDVTITGNTFRNGGRGAWINQPVNFTMTGNVFVNNTTKNEPDMRRGRIAYQTGKPVQFPELYFTVYEENARYGPVIVRDNIFQVGDSAPTDAVTFAPGGHDIQMTGNSFQGKTVTIVADPTLKDSRIEANDGATTEIRPVKPDHGRR